jgi:hypothetical protein
MSDSLMEVLSELKSEFKCDSEGKAFSSIRGVARLVGVDESSIREALSCAGFTMSKIAQKLMEQGFDGAGLTSFSKNGIPDIAIATILEYYTFDAGARCTEQAKKVLRFASRIGLRVVMQKAVNWQPAEQPKKVKSKLEQDLMMAAYLQKLFELQVALAHDLNWYSKAFPVVYGLVLEMPESADYKQAYHQSSLSKASDEPLEITSEKYVPSKDFQMSKDLTLMMNRMGLAYNKSLQTFKELEGITDPKNIDKVRKAYQNLLGEFDKLAKTHSESEKKLLDKDETINKQQTEIIKLTTLIDKLDIRIAEVKAAGKQDTINSLNALESANYSLKIENIQLKKDIEKLKKISDNKKKEDKQPEPKALKSEDAPNVYTLTPSRY